MDELCNLFNYLYTKLKGQVTNVPGKGLSIKPSLPLVAGLVLRLQLLHPDHWSKITKAEETVAAMGIADNSNVNVEALRRLSLAEWPHMEYK